MGMELLDCLNRCGRDDTNAKHRRKVKMCKELCAGKKRRNEIDFC